MRVMLIILFLFLSITLFSQEKNDIVYNIIDYYLYMNNNKLDFIIYTDTTKSEFKNYIKKLNLKTKKIKFNISYINNINDVKKCDIFIYESNDIKEFKKIKNKDYIDFTNSKEILKYNVVGFYYYKNDSIFVDINYKNIIKIKKLSVNKILNRL
jgi:hypothetical protein